MKENDTHPNAGERLHRFTADIGGIPLPEQFTYPFHYTPHPLSVEAAREVQAYLAAREDWQAEVAQGKMFGVLVVRDSTGQPGFLAAFSGMLAGRNCQDYFVPPIYDLQEAGGFFQPEEQAISDLNHRIDALEHDGQYLRLREALEEEEQAARLETGLARMRLQDAKNRRDHWRATHPGEADTPEMTRESQFQKAEFRRLKQRCAQAVAARAAEMEAWEQGIARLKEERRTRSAALQRRLFGQFHILNARGETKDLCTLFAEAGRGEPPAGAGECAAPRLLQYAYLHGLQPVALAEFWQGASPRTELRRHGCYYPACKGKCEPILRHMLQGLDVEPNPLAAATPAPVLDIVWEDPWLVAINKPAGVLSAPGKTGQISLAQLVEARYPSSRYVHRLDMATSGLLLFAKDAETYRQMQALFHRQAVRKRYAAWVESILPSDEGVIELPLRPDPDDRPRQCVDFRHGKPAVTRYAVVARREGRTLVHFYPLTGRTHQLRVHAAHPLGLNAPIVGDALYGHPADRLCLHAEALEFTHPVTGKHVRIEKKAPF